MLELIIIGIILCCIVNNIAEKKESSMAEGFIGFALTIIIIVIVFIVFSML